MNKEIDIRVILEILRRQLVWLLVMAVLGAFAAFLITTYFIPEKYTSTTRVLITNMQSERVNASDLSVSRSLASTYCVLLTSPTAKSRLKDKLYEAQMDDKLKSLEDKQEVLSKAEREALEAATRSTADSNVDSCNITAKVVSSTEVVEITVVSGTASLSARVAELMAEVAKEWIPEIYGEDSSSTTLKEKVKPSSSPSFPDVKVAILIGAMVGILLVAGIALLIYFADNRVKDEADFVNKVGVPVLGAVPNMDQTEARNGGGYYAYNYSEKKDK